MVSLRWCCKQKDGIRLVDSNDNLAKGYLKMAEDYLGTMNRERKYNMMFSVSACYYSMYYSLYAVCMKFGIKCEIHSCSLELMKKLLGDYYSDSDIKIIRKAFDTRNITQYYVDRIVSNEDTDFIISKAPFFVTKSREILFKISDEDIKKVRGEIGRI